METKESLIGDRKDMQGCKFIVQTVSPPPQTNQNELHTNETQLGFPNFWGRDGEKEREEVPEKRVRRTVKTQTTKKGKREVYWATH